MVYIYKKKIAGKDYYYLRMSQRKKGRVISKDIAYLGDTLSQAKKKVLNLSNFKDEIRRSYRRINLFFETEHYLDLARKLKLRDEPLLGKNFLEIEACKLHYLENFQKKDKKTKEEILNDFSINFSYNTTSIEGNTITLKEAQNFFEEGKTPKERTLREIYDLQNTKKLFLKLFDLKEDISHELIISFHKDLMENIDNRIGYRTLDNRVFRAHFNSTPGIYVKSDMDLLIKWYNESRDKLHPLVLATIFHHKFEKIHPFSDGNGRTGRILINFILMKREYPPLIIYKKNRTNYLDSLGSADKIPLTKTDETKYKTLISFISEELINSYWNVFL